MQEEQKRSSGDDFPSPGGMNVDVIETTGHYRIRIFAGEEAEP
jgi:hypothetical protein